MDKTFLLAQNELETLCKILPKKGVLLLRGDLASGKTTLVKAIAKHLHVNEEVTSPTFSILHSYEDKLHHYDIYQNKTKGFLKQGLHEKLFEDGLHVIEWGDEEFENLLERMGIGYAIIEISLSGEDKRYYKVTNAQA